MDIYTNTWCKTQRRTLKVVSQYAMTTRISFLCHHMILTLLMPKIEYIEKQRGTNVRLNNPFTGKKVVLSANLQTKQVDFFQSYTIGIVGEEALLLKSQSSNQYQT